MSLNEKPHSLPANPRLSGLEADIAVTRARLGQRLSELRYKVTPTGLIQEAQALFLDTSSPARAPAQAYVRQLRRSPTRLSKPSTALLALAGAATAWLLVRAYKSRSNA